MTQSLIHTLTAIKHESPTHPRGIGFNEGVDAAAERLRALLDDPATVEAVATAIEQEGVSELDAEDFAKAALSTLKRLAGVA